MRRHDVVAIGGSAGGFRALTRLLEALPEGFPAALLAVLHLPRERSSGLAGMLGRSARMPVTFAEEGETISPGRVYLAPPDRHLLANGDRLLLRRGPIENGSRPAIDPLFRSVACSFGGRAIGVVLTGYLDDGTAGLLAIRRCGGVAVVQDPADAEFSDMPRSALTHAEPDHVVALEALPGLLLRLVAEPAGPSPAPSPDLRLELKIAAQQISGIALPERLGERSVLTCPECHGTLWEIRDGDLTRYRCHTGHAYGMEALAHSQVSDLDRALGSALRALDERVHLCRDLAAQARRSGRNPLVRHWEARVAEHEEQAQLIRQLLLSRQADDLVPEDDSPAATADRTR